MEKLRDIKKNRKSKRETGNNKNYNNTAKAVTASLPLDSTPRAANNRKTLELKDKRISISFSFGDCEGEGHSV